MQTIDLFDTLFHQLRIKYTYNNLYTQVTFTPYINSMYGIGLILAKYNIDHKCIKLTQKDKILNIPIGIIIFRGAFVLVRCSAKSDCKIYYNNENIYHLSLQDLYDGWDGVIMTVQKKDSSIEPNFNKKEERNAQLKTICGIILFLTAIAISVVYNLQAYTMAIALVIAVNIFGIGVSYLLLQKQLHIPNKFADKLCGLAKESHCEDVTQSDGATFLGLFKLSEIGTSFFGVNLIVLIFAPHYAPALSIIAAVVLPFSFWSIWYQKVKAKSWCVLCLLTLLLMWIQAGLYLVGGLYVCISTVFMPLALLCISYFITVFVINRIMWLIELKRKGATWKGEFHYLKSLNYVIDAYCTNAKHYNVSIENCSSLYFGDDLAPHLITIFSNPYCGPCAQMHKRVEGYPGENVRIQYVMTFFSADRSIINKYIIAAYQQLGASRTWELLTDWYDGGKQQGETFFDPFNLDITTDEVTKEFEKQLKWSKNDSLYGTPTVLVNGTAVEYPYEVSDYILFPYEN